MTLADGTVLRDVQRATTNTSLRINYDLNTGAQVRRNYSDLIITADMLADPDSAASKLQALLNRPEVNWYGYFPEDISAWTLVEARLTVPSDGQVWTVNAERYGPEYADTVAEEAGEGRVDIPKEGWDDLRAAVESDLRAGRIGRRYLLDAADRRTNCFYNDLELTFYVPGLLGTSYDARTGEAVSRASDRGARTVTITVQKSATDTLAVLDRLGLTDRLVLQADMK